MYSEETIYKSTFYRNYHLIQQKKIYSLEQNGYVL